jgi:hydrogenase nickel incorporation protein HypA/HybF
MHEVALVKNIFTSIEEAFPNKMHLVRDIYVQVGLLSNVQPILMQNAFKAVQETEAMYAKTTLYVEVLPILIQCTTCNAVTTITNYTFVCVCGQPCKNIIQGNEMSINKVTFDNS